MTSTLFAGNLEILLRLMLALALGAALGTERIAAKKLAGMRTYGLVSMAAALFVIISNLILEPFIASGIDIDPTRIASQIIVGIGFIGGGLIIYRKSKLTGLTTAVGLWVVAGIGMATGFGLYLVACFTTLLTLFAFTILWFIENKAKKTLHWNNGNHQYKE